ncbi:MAG: type II toxin-antitoxin system PemK/MazF family toxin [Fimbriiglobus sp.]
MADSIAQGRIVWANLLDPQGRNPKLRPAVILTATAEIAQAVVVLVAAITSKLDVTPPEVCVELPWQANGHPRTKLKHPSVVVCTWQVRLPVEEIVSLGGVVPLAQMIRVIEIVTSLEAELPPDELPQPET